MYEQSLGLNQGTLCDSFLKETSISEHVSFQIEVLQKFRNDPTGTLCKTDSKIIKVGRKLWANSARKDRKALTFKTSNDIKIKKKIDL